MTRTGLSLTVAMHVVACGGATTATHAPAPRDPHRAPLASHHAAPVVASEGGSEDDVVKLTPGEDNAFEFKEADRAGRPTGVEGSKLRPSRTHAVVRFILVDKDNGPIPGIVVSMTAPDGTKYYTEETDRTGFAELLVPVGQKYDLVYLSLGRRRISASVPVSDEPNQNIKLTLRYRRHDPPEGGRGRSAGGAPRFVLAGVEFDTGKARIREESLPRLDEVVEYMAHKRSARIEISGHTDNVGSPKRNKALSQKRADACREYLISKGIEANRITAVGHGDERPVASNDTEAGRQQNRRIEAVEL